MTDDRRTETKMIAVTGCQACGGMFRCDPRTDDPYHCRPCQEEFYAEAARRSWEALLATPEPSGAEIDAAANEELRRKGWD